MKTIYELIDKELFVREPVDEICDKLINCQDKKIILTGGRGVGKSVVLSALENRCLGTKNACINIRFDAAGFGTCFEEKFYIHYYELVFCNKLLHYINENYSLMYNKYFKEYDLVMSNYFEELDNYVNNFIYKDVSIKKYLSNGELSNEVLNKIKEILKLDSLTLVINRFDWTANRNPIVQKVLSDYFDMFDKTIITSDDEELKQKEGYSIVNIEYGKDVEVVKEIIRKYVFSYDTGKSGYEQLPVDSINDEVYISLIERTRGNIELMLETLKEVIINWEWDCKDFNIHEEFDKETKYKVKKFNEIQAISVKPKLYL